MAILNHPFSRDGFRATGPGYEGKYHHTPLTGKQGERHGHEYYELYIHLHGGELFSLERELFQLQPNYLVVIPPYHMHGLIYDQPLKDYERMYLYVMPEVLKEAGHGLIDIPRLLDTATAGGRYAFELTPEDTQRAKECIQQIRNNASANGSERFDVYLAMLEYLQIVVRAVESSDHVETVTDSGASYPLVQKVMSYLDSHFTEHISLQAVAEIFHISVSHLCHEFARYNRHSIYDYVLYRRVTGACEMIRRGMSLTETAYSCGFENYNSFLRAFHKFVGGSPRDYSRAIRRTE